MCVCVYKQSPIYIYIYIYIDIFYHMPYHRMVSYIIQYHEYIYISFSVDSGDSFINVHLAKYNSSQTDGKST